MEYKILSLEDIILKGDEYHHKFGSDHWNLCISSVGLTVRIALRKYHAIIDSYRRPLGEREIEDYLLHYKISSDSLDTISIALQEIGMVLQKENGYLKIINKGSEISRHPICLRI